MSSKLKVVYGTNENGGFGLFKCSLVVCGLFCVKFDVEGVIFFKSVGNHATESSHEFMHNRVMSSC